MRISDWSSDVCSSDLFHGNLGTHLSLHGSQYLAIIQIHPCAVQPLRLKQVARQRNGGMRRPSNGLYPFDGIGQKIRVALVCISKLMHETAVGAIFQQATDEISQQIAMAANGRISTATITLLLHQTLVQSLAHRSEEHTSELQSLMR